MFFKSPPDQEAGAVAAPPSTTPLQPVATPGISCNALTFCDNDKVASLPFSNHDWNPDLPLPIISDED